MADRRKHLLADYHTGDVVQPGALVRLKPRLYDSRAMIYLFEDWNNMFRPDAEITKESVSAYDPDNYRVPTKSIWVQDRTLLMYLGKKGPWYFFLCDEQVYWLSEFDSAVTLFGLAAKR